MYSLPLIAVVGNSPRRLAILIAAHLAAAGAIFIAAISPMAQAAGLIALSLSMAYYSRPSPPVRLRGNQDGTLDVWLQDHWEAAQVGGDSVIWPNYLIVRLGFPNQRWRNLLIASDSMPAPDFRRLLIWLRWRLKPVGDAQSGAHDAPDQ